MDSWRVDWKFSIILPTIYGAVLKEAILCVPGLCISCNPPSCFSNQSGPTSYTPCHDFEVINVYSHMTSELRKRLFFVILGFYPERWKLVDKPAWLMGFPLPLFLLYASPIPRDQ